MPDKKLSFNIWLNIEKDSAEHVRTERVEVKTGNAMIDPFVAWYFGVALAFIFTYNAAFCS